MLGYIGKEIRIVRNYIDGEQGELFRIYTDGCSMIAEYPYFTDNYFYVPQYYISKYLNERSPVLSASFSATTISMAQSGVINIFLTEQKTSISQKMFIHGKSLRCKLSIGIHHIVEDISNFYYDRTTNGTASHNYGVMVFRRLA
jgi:hypothetical protein